MLGGATLLLPGLLPSPASPPPGNPGTSASSEGANDAMPLPLGKLWYGALGEGPVHSWELTVPAEAPTS